MSSKVIDMKRHGNTRNRIQGWLGCSAGQTVVFIVCGIGESGFDERGQFQCRELGPSLSMGKWNDYSAVGSFWFIPELRRQIMKLLGDVFDGDTSQ
jgi:hypothetical protein